MRGNELYLSDREDRIQEILDPPLWFEGYSIYRTPWCKMWIALTVFNPYFSQSQIRIDDLYQSILYEWQLHHYPNDELGIRTPNPPQLFQLEEAVKYFYYKQVVVETVIPSSRHFKDYSTKQETRLMLPPPKDPRKHQGILGKVSHEIKKQLLHLLS